MQNNTTTFSRVEQAVQLCLWQRPLQRQIDPQMRGLKSNRHAACDHITTDIPHYDELFPNKDEWGNLGDAVIYKPFGGVHAGPMHQKKGMLFANIDVQTAQSSRRKFDASGHYARPDVFSLSVNRTKQSPVTFI